MKKSTNYRTIEEIKYKKSLLHKMYKIIFRASFISLIGSLVSQCPNKILLEILLFINREYAGLKDRKGKIWDRVTALVYVDLLDFYIY